MAFRHVGVSLAARAKTVRVVDLAMRYNPWMRHPVVAALRQSRARDPATLRALNARLTCAILEQAHKTAYGRGFGAHVAGWPVLSKEAVRAAPSAFTTRGLLRIPAATGGTTGVPLRLVRSLRSAVAEQVFLDELLAPHGLSWGRARVAVLRGDAIKDPDDTAPPFGQAVHGGRRLILSSAHLNVESLSWYLDRITAFRPDILFAYPTTLGHLLALLARSGQRLRVPIVVVSSERLDAHLYAFAAAALGATVIDYYGLAERSVLAVRHAADRWVFEPAYGSYELLPDPDEAIVDGRRHVRIVATGFWNEAQPLIRYDTGDRAIVPADAGAAELDAIALGQKPFHGIAGRADEFVWAPDGRPIAGLNQIVREVRNVLQVQIMQDAPDRLVVRIRALPGFGDRDRARLVANLRSKVPRAMALTLELAEDLQRTPQGKTPFIIRRIAAQDLHRCDSVM